MGKEKQRHGNRWNHDYDNTIRGLMKKKQKDLDRSIHRRKAYGHLSKVVDKPNYVHYFSEFVRAIGNRKTAQKHVDAMVKSGELIEYPKVRIGKSFQRPYALGPKRIYKIGKPLNVSATIIDSLVPF